MYISVNSVRKRISIVLFTQLLKYLYRPIGIEYWNLKLKNFIQPPFHREVRHLQVVEIVVKNFSKMGCDQGATTPSYWAGRLA